MIAYHLPTSATVRLEVFSSLGEKIVTLVDAVQSTGFHAYEWDGEDDAGRRVPAGWYILRLDVATRRRVRRIPLTPEYCSADNS